MMEDARGSLQSAPESKMGEYEQTFVVECTILGISMLLPFPMDVSVKEIARKTYEEYKSMHPRAPPLKITCVQDKNGKVLNKDLTLDEHHLDRAFVVYVEEYNQADLLNNPERVTEEYRKWQLWTVHQVYDMIQVSLREKADDDASSVALKVSNIRNSIDYDEDHHLDDTDHEWAPPSRQAEQDVDQRYITLLDELSNTPDARVKCACLEALNLLRLRSCSVAVVKAASLRIVQLLSEEDDFGDNNNNNNSSSSSSSSSSGLDVVLCALNCFRANAKGLLPLSSFHQKEIRLLRTAVVDRYMHVLARFPDPEDQRLVMSSYKSMYIHRYGMDTGIGTRGAMPNITPGAAGAGAGTEAVSVFAPGGSGDDPEQTVARLRSLLDSQEESVWKFAVTKLHTLLNDIRNPIDRISCFDASVETRLVSLFHSNQEVKYITTCLLKCLKDCIDTTRRDREGRGARSSSSSSSHARAGMNNRKANKAKAVIDAALLSADTDIVMVKRVVDCLYLLSLPFSFDVGVADNSESSILSSIQVSVAKACLEGDRWRLLLTLCSATNLAIAGRCAFLVRMVVLVQGREHAEGNHWEKFQGILDPAAFVSNLHNDAAAASDYKAVQYNDQLNSTGFGANHVSDIDSVEVLEAHLALLVLDYCSHLLNAKREPPAVDYKKKKKKKKEEEEEEEEGGGAGVRVPLAIESARGERGVQAMEQLLKRTDAMADAGRRGMPSKLSQVLVDGDQTGVEYVSRVTHNAGSTNADKYVLEDVFRRDNNKLFLKLWRMANYTEIPMPGSNDSNLKGANPSSCPKDTLRIASCYQQRRLALFVISQLVAMDSEFKDQLNRLAGVPKLIALLGDKSLMRIKLDGCGGGPNVSPRPGMASPRSPRGTDGDEYEYADDDSGIGDNKGEVDALELLSKQVDVEAARFALKILVTLIVSQDQFKQKTIVRLLQELEVGGAGNALRLHQVAQIDRQSAFFYATILTLGSKYGE
jgi:hypothetical protein